TGCGPTTRARPPMSCWPPRTSVRSRLCRSWPCGSTRLTFRRIPELLTTDPNPTVAVSAWLRWMERWPTVEALSDASLREVLREWQGLGYPRRARDLHRSAQLIIGSGWPD